MFTLNCNGRLLMAEKPLVMGIINVTPDSFYPESRHEGIDTILKAAEKMIKEGAAILDIGGQSTRPGSEMISEEEELKRVIGPVSAVCREFPSSYISIDTWYSKVAKEAAAAGAAIINDVSAGSFDDKMWETVAGLKLPYVIMHMQGTPQTMQKAPVYEDLGRELLDYFIWKIKALEDLGIVDIIIDPGFGFGKTMADNFELMRKLSIFKILERPLLLGVSRKSTIAKTLDVKTGDTLNGTTVLNTIGLMNGAAILRVHDVKEAVEAITLLEACRQNKMEQS